MSAVRADVCVIGGGPAGTIFAAQLTGLGYDVVLIERRAFPSAGAGQSLTPGTSKLLTAAGAPGALAAAGALPLRQARVRWDGTTMRKPAPAGRPGVASHPKSGALAASHPGSVSVDRGRLDELLLELAHNAGVRLLQPAIARTALHSAAGWTIRLSGTVADTVHARFLADASGRQSPLPRRRISTSAPTLALQQIWHGRAEPERPDAMIVEAIRDGWLWGAPLPDGTFASIAFIDADLLRRRGVRRAGLEGLHRELIASTELFGHLLEARPVAPLEACGATSYVSADPITETMIKLGDAALAIDPLSSAGIEQALQTALSGAAAVNTLLDGGDRGTAIAFYRDSVRDSAARHAAWASRLYAENELRRDAPFWHRRARRAPQLAPSTRSDPVSRSAMPVPAATRPPRRCSFAELADRPLRLSQDARLAPTPAIVGDRVELRPALTAPGLERPVAYLQGIEIAALLRSFDGRATAEIVHKWSSSMSPEQARSIVAWLWRAEALDD